MISVKNNKAPPLPMIHMNCDEPLHSKLDEYELTKFMNCHSTNLFLGKPKSGKSHLLQSLFKSPKIFRKVFHNIYVFRPSTSKLTVKDDIFDKLPEDQEYNELTLETLADVESKLNIEHIKVLLTTWKTYDGFPLTKNLNEIDLGGYKSYYFDNFPV